MTPKGVEPHFILNLNKESNESHRNQLNASLFVTKQHFEHVKIVTSYLHVINASPRGAVTVMIRVLQSLTR